MAAKTLERAYRKRKEKKRKEKATHSLSARNSACVTMVGGFPTYPDPEYLQYLEQAQEIGEDQVAILVDDDDDDDDEDYEEDYNDGQEDGPVPPPPRVSSGSRSTLSQEAVIALSSDNVAEENEVSWKTTEGSETTSLQGEVQWTRSEIDDLFCPICMDAWTNGGDHQICCLPCGHLYGASCIKRWLLQRKNSGKCPQCNRKCSMKDARVIYAQQIVTVDHRLQKKVPSLEAKCASFEKKFRIMNGKWKKKNDRGKKLICIRKCTTLQRELVIWSNYWQRHKTDHQDCSMQVSVLKNKSCLVITLIWSLAIKDLQATLYFRKSCR